MKLLGILLIIGGVGMFAFHGFSFTQEKRVADIGPVEINKQEDKTVSWPSYAGAVAILGGIAVLSLGTVKN
jgi:hypothetical protein